MADTTITTVSSAPVGVLAHIREVLQYRELLVGLVRKELKVKYKNSSLGFLWSMLNPALYLVVFYVVFQVFLGSGIPRFPIYLLSGLLVWNFFSTSLGAATGSITANSSLVNKVFFPRTILPLASVGASLVHFFLQGIVLLGALAVFQQPVPWSYLWLIVPALAVLLVMASAFGILLGAVNVYARDTQHLLELVLLAWMWLTPIVYQYQLVATKLEERDLPSWLALLNPVTPIILCFQRGIYGTVSSNGVEILPDESQWWYLRNLGFVAIFAAVLLSVAVRVFDRLQGNFAEEL
jgi:ABC-2 type transport system permease protein